MAISHLRLALFHQMLTKKSSYANVFDKAKFDAQKKKDFEENSSNNVSTRSFIIRKPKKTSSANVY
ncbi:hypothetical protein A0J61_09658 [Choanephora cucurbitarum]|uniref:Uncharacterized protein n=1 Tax=Choanephora cucurbitarum TaxID=101091 RepID=A0A1C7MZP1_9FUNG|nr:hypothetical protein A0J61_09658 [Choanephora cucurbitarum]